jgi:AraC-like DNA-binding protein
MRENLISGLALKVAKASIANIGIHLPTPVEERFTTLIDNYQLDQWVSSTELDALYCTAIEVSDKPELGLLLAASPVISQYNTHYLITALAPTFGHALKNLLTFSQLTQTGCELSVLHDDPSRLTLRFEPNHCSDAGKICRTDFLICGMLQLMRLADFNWQTIKNIRLRFSPPSHAEIYYRYFGMKPTFDAPHNEIIAKPEILSYAMPMAQSGIYNDAISRAHISLAQIKQQRGLIDDIESAVMKQLAVRPSLQELASQMRVTDRTLRRRLAELGTSYQEIVTRCQKAKASHLLASGEHTIQQVASEVGFQSVTAFYRAFYKWTGRAPGAWAHNLSAKTIRSTHDIESSRLKTPTP